jgi:hypothetical protein
LLAPPVVARVLSCSILVQGALPFHERSRAAGHEAVGNKADLVLFRDVLVEIRDKVAALKKQGKSLPEVVAAKPGARYDAVWGNLFQNPSDFVALVYQGV